jgi:hypothetical protein
LLIVLLNNTREKKYKIPFGVFSAPILLAVRKIGDSGFLILDFAKLIFVSTHTSLVTGSENSRA